MVGGVGLGVGVGGGCIVCREVMIGSEDLRNFCCGYYCGKYDVVE